MRLPLLFLDLLIQCSLLGGLTWGRFLEVLSHPRYSSIAGRIEVLYEYRNSWRI